MCARPQKIYVHIVFLKCPHYKAITIYIIVQLFYIVSTQIAIPIPPPIHKEATPFLAVLLFIPYKSVTNIRAPDDPTG